MNFKKFLNEVENVGMGDKTSNSWWSPAYKVLKTAVDYLPVVGPAISTVVTVTEIINDFKNNKNIKEKLKILINTKDENPGIPANAFDLEDSISDRLSDKAKEEIIDQIIKGLNKILKQNPNPNLPQDFANRMAVNYVRKMINNFRTNLGQKPI